MENHRALFMFVVFTLAAGTTGLALAGMLKISGVRVSWIAWAALLTIVAVGGIGLIVLKMQLATSAKSIL